MTASEMVQHIGKRLGIPELCLNELGLCRIRLNDSIVIDFEEDDTKNWLHVFAALTDDAAFLSRDTLLKLFRAHYLFNDTGHASFGVNAEDRLCLFMRAPTSEMAEELWVEMFEAFFSTYLEWKEKLSSGATEDPLPGDELPDLPPSTFIRV
ncbi:Tir chaperone protein (CesT) family protein [Desulfomicrobium norvegicum]|uniref:Tir chaperone protein (CesT) family protein n=1 Tax=Desulfomicrobium norvegicum (strain DSM 1741 / NCIMB 8310) TaxID=52561 RepID=A0A8G2C008_DESNO|nr:type III secretion system chaperone [Desulfomicrobium norvegicum]SFL29743.1 Tir chaperone protein (CesT) family protein [Desulfomicrobium norvegicum]